MAIATMLRADVVTLPSGTDWWDRYGAVGVVAFLALGALVVLGRNYIVDRRAETARIELEKKTLREMVDAAQSATMALNEKMIEVVQEAHGETLELMEEQREIHEKRFQALFERHMAMTERAAESMQEMATVVSGAIDSLSRKLRDGG